MKKLVAINEVMINEITRKVGVAFETDLGDLINLEIQEVYGTWEVIEKRGAKGNLKDTYVSMIIDMVVSGVEKITANKTVGPSDIGTELVTMF